MELVIVNPSTAVISLEGKITSDAETVLKAEVKEAQRNSIGHIVLNFQATDHIDDYGLSSLVKMIVTARRYGIQLYTCALPERYRDIFRMTGIDEAFQPFESTEVKKNILDETEHILIEKVGIEGKHDDTGWAPRFDRIQLHEEHGRALAKNMNGRSVQGPLQGFGCLWQKTYQLRVDSPGATPHDVITAVKQHFPEFQPSYNRFYPTSKGISPGEYVLIDSKTPGGIVSTGVIVMYADDTGFSFITPDGHPEAGWVSFRAVDTGETIEMTIRGLASASDPLYELAFRIAGSKMQETIWTTVLENLARYLGVIPEVRMNKILVDRTCHWNRFGNIRYNAQLRTLPYNPARLFGW